MEQQEIEQALTDVFDQALLCHAFTDYMRDYEMVFHCSAAPSTGIAPEHLRYLFRHCVVAEVESTVRPDVWSKSLDDALIVYETGVDLDGFVWGVKCQRMYPGARLVPDSARADSWSKLLQIPFHEMQLETEAHRVTLVFSDLEVSTVDRSFVAFRVGE